MTTYRKVTRHGHPRADVQGHVAIHVLVVERALGKPLPIGAEVHHVDEDKANNAPSNLVVCQDRAYHKLLHARARVVRAGGDPNTQRLCSKCRHALPLAAFNRNQNACRECQRIYWRERAA